MLQLWRGEGTAGPLPQERVGSYSKVVNEDKQGTV